MIISVMRIIDDNNDDFVRKFKTNTIIVVEILSREISSYLVLTYLTFYHVM